MAITIENINTAASNFKTASSNFESNVGDAASKMRDAKAIMERSPMAGDTTIAGYINELERFAKLLDDLAIGSEQVNSNLKASMEAYARGIGTTFNTGTGQIETTTTKTQQNVSFGTSADGMTTTTTVGAGAAAATYTTISASMAARSPYLQGSSELSASEQAKAKEIMLNNWSSLTARSATSGTQLETYASYMKIEANKKEIEEYQNKLKEMGVDERLIPKGNTSSVSGSEDWLNSLKKTYLKQDYKANPEKYQQYWDLPNKDIKASDLVDYDTSLTMSADQLQGKTVYMSFAEASSKGNVPTGTLVIDGTPSEIVSQLASTRDKDATLRAIYAANGCYNVKMTTDQARSAVVDYAVSNMSKSDWESYATSIGLNSDTGLTGNEGRSALDILNDYN